MRFHLKGCQFVARQSDCMRYERDLSMQKGKNMNFHLKCHNHFYHQKVLCTKNDGFIPLFHTHLMCM